jgi:hypothetical protein
VSVTIVPSARGMKKRIDPFFSTFWTTFLCLAPVRDSGDSMGFESRSPSQLWPNSPNLRLRPHAPNAGRGRLQRQIARAFIAHGPVLTSSDVYRWCKRWQAREFGQWERWSIVRILDVVAERTGRASTIGRPWLWRLKQPGAEEPSPSTD